MTRYAALLALSLAACGDAASQSTPPPSTLAPRPSTPAAPTTPQPITLALPIACDVGRTCHVQNHFDHDPTPGRRDHACGAQTYDGHDGLDIRLPTLTAMRSGVAVLAAAPGVVRGVRDGMADVSIRQTGADTVANRECGNGAAIVHAGGWETQYCHMAQGSLRVRQGQTVAAGDPLGNVGMSGSAEFPHVHLAVRRGGEEVDPLAYGAPAAACSGGLSLFNPSATAALAYRPGEVIGMGFAGGPVTEADVDNAALTPTGLRAPLVAWTRAINLRAGDVQTLTVTGPNNAEVHTQTGQPLDRDKASWLMFAGRRPPGGAWPAGDYRARYTVTRAGRVVIERTTETTLR